MKIVVQNKKAFAEYDILEKYEAGIVLTGAEIKAIRAGKVNLKGSFARIFGGKKQLEIYAVNLHIGITEGDPTRSRKLLLHRKEINRLIGKIEQKGLTLLPLRLYFKKNLAKLELGLGRGLKLHSKKEKLKKRDIEREIFEKI